MNTNRSRRMTAVVATPVAAATIFAATLGVPVAANASSVVPGVDTHTSGMVLSKEYTAMESQEQGNGATPIDLQTKQETPTQTDSPAAQEANALRGDLKADEEKEGALKTVESLANVQTPEPKSHAYVLKNPIRKHLGMMKAGFSQMAR
jgi:hypothetical protein